MKYISSTEACGILCPVGRTAHVLEGKWTILVVRDLLGGTKRYSELQRSLTGISPRLLAARLKSLEAEGIVKRTAYPTVPPTTEYALTGQGMALLPVVQAMAQFGQILLERGKETTPKASTTPDTRSGKVTRVRQGKKIAT